MFKIALANKCFRHFYVEDTTFPQFIHIFFFFIYFVQIHSTAEMNLTNTQNFTIKNTKNNYTISTMIFKTTISIWSTYGFSWLSDMHDVLEKVGYIYFTTQIQRLKDAHKIRPKAQTRSWKLMFSLKNATPAQCIRGWKWTDDTGVGGVDYARHLSGKYIIPAGLIF